MSSFLWLLLLLVAGASSSLLSTDLEAMATFQDDDETVEGIKIYKNPRNAPSNNCPRDDDAAHRMGRTCLRKCSSDSDCLSRKKVCLCDGICGMSCIKPDKECGELVNPMFGFVEVNGRVVGSKAKYKCQKVYHLIGSEERICQADGSWSRTPPECRENLYCTDPPIIPNAKHDVPEGQTRFNVNHTLEYSCEEGYTTSGFTAAKCYLYNGTMQWFGPEIQCLPKSCGDLGDIPNGYKEGSCFKYSCKVNFFCRPGFQIVGRSDYYCQNDGTWSPRELPSCKGLDQGQFKDVQCDIPKHPKNGKVIYTTVSYNSVVTYECEHGFMVVGSNTRRCGSDKQWSKEQPECKEINCGSLGPLSNGWLENSDEGTALGSSIVFRCFSNTTLRGTNSSVCQSDGKWSQPIPQCLAPCIVPEINFGFVNNTEDKKVEHGFELDIICNETFELEFDNAPPTCHNGTWSQYPSCKPARCKELPPKPRHGMVIVPKSDHGMKAKFRCRDGYSLQGNATTECRFGNWSARAPKCIEVYCPYPGTVNNGRVLLVGHMGMYDYRSYVQKIKNNRQIIYKCNKGYFLIKGPPGATCIAGRWSPDKLPKCVPDLHPKMQWFRKKRSILKHPHAEEIYSAKSAIVNRKRRDESYSKELMRNDEYAKDFDRDKGYSKSFMREFFLHYDNQDPFQQPAVNKRSAGNATVSSVDSSEDRKRLRMERREKRRKLRIRKKGFRNKSFAHCEEITEEAFMQVEIVRAGRDDNYTFSSGVRVRVTCLHGYGLNIGNKTAKCARGRWKPFKPECYNLPCSVPETHHGEFTYNAQPVLDGATISHGEVVKFACEPGYNVLGSDTMRCWYGEWAVTGKNPECHPDACLLTEILHGTYDSRYKQNLSVNHGSLVSYNCDSGFIKAVTDIRCHIGHLQPSSPTCVTPPTVQTEPHKRSEAVKVKKQILINLTTPSPVGRTYQDSQSSSGQSSSAKLVAVPTMMKSCPPPPKIKNTISYSEPGVRIDPNQTEYPHTFNVTIHCQLLFKSKDTPGIGMWIYTCEEDGTWNVTMNTCDHWYDDGIYGNKTCMWHRGGENVVTFYNDRELTDDTIEFPGGTHLISRCIDIGKFAMEGGIVRKCKYGEWTGEEPECFGLSQEYDYALDKPPTILIRHYRGPIAQRNDGLLVVYPRTTLYLECLWIRRYGTPRWNVSQTITEIDPKKKKKKKKKKLKTKGKGRGGIRIDRKYPEGWTTDRTRNRQLEYRLSLYKIKKDDSGTYICTTPAMTQHMVTVDVKAVHCPIVEEVPGLHIEPNSTKMSTEVMFNCDAGSMLVGAESIRCKASGNWSAPLPHCEKVRCRQPKPPDNGSVEGTGPYHAGDMVQISCLPNFKMDGSPMIVCQQNGNWSEEIPNCVEACTYPGTIISGTMSSVKFYYAIGDTVTYTCSDEFILHGSRQIECLDGARWSGPVPQCEGKA